MASLSDRIRTAVGMPSSAERTLHRLVEELPVVPIGDARPGLNAVEGTVAVYEETVPEPATTDTCVYAQYEIRERGEERAGEVQYETVEGRVDAVPFVVEDDAGELLVDPTGVDHPGPGRVGRGTEAAGPLPLSDRNTRAFGVGEDGGDFEEIAERRLLRDETDPATWVYPEIHVQSTIHPGDRVYVLGELERRTGSGPRWVVVPGDGPFLVSDVGKSTLATMLERQSGDVSSKFVRFLVGGLIAVLAVILLVTIAVVLVTQLPQAP